MEYGVVFFKETDNVGDDIQSYAAMQFLPQVDYWIDRERLSDFQSEGEKVATILNGWFLHKKYNWPPSQDILPLCISMHFTPNDHWGIKYDFLKDDGLDFFKYYEPIGCRDTSTANLLSSLGVSTYLSGCLTLTLPKPQKPLPLKPYICAVDLNDHEYEILQGQIPPNTIDIHRISHTVDYRANPLSISERFHVVEEYLREYANALCVVTTRLHCALPCLAFETPVLLLYDAQHDDSSRFSYFSDLLHVASHADFLKKNFDFSFLDPPSNPIEYKSLRASLTEKAQFFISQTQNPDFSATVSTFVPKKVLVSENKLTTLQDISLASSKNNEALKREISAVKLARDKKVKFLGEEIQLRERAITEHIQQNVQMKNSLDTYMKQNAKIKKIVDENIEENIRLKGMLDNKKEELHTLKQTLNERDKIIIQLERKVETHESNAIALSEKTQQLLQKQYEELHVLNRALQEQEKKNLQLQDINQALQEQLQKIYSSRLVRLLFK